MSESVHFGNKRIGKYRLGSLFIKNLALISMLIILPLTSMLIIYSIAFDSFLSGEINNYGSKSIKVIQTQTDEMIDTFTRQIKQFAGDLGVSVFIQTAQGESIFYDFQEISKQMRTQSRMAEYLHSIYIYSDKSGKVISNIGEVFPESLYDMDWLESYREHKGRDSSWYEIRTTENSSILPQKILSLYMAVRYGRGDNSGVIVYNIDLTAYHEQLRQLRTAYDEALFITDGEGNIVETIWGEPSLLQGDVLFTDGISYVKKNDHVLYTVPIQGTSWWYAAAVPLAMYEQNLRPLRMMITMILIVGIAITALLAFFISLRIYKPYRSIRNMLEQPVGYTESILARGEEGYILSAIRDALSENKAINRELEERIRLLKRAQALALQAQINPHFLHNTLDAINWRAMRLTGGKNEASEMISKLAAMLRYALEDSGTLVTLGEELENVRTYLELQALRYKDRFRVAWEVEEGLSSLYVMKLTLQPIVENAIYHGLKPIEGKGVITLSAHAAGSKINLSVVDNGAGIDTKTLLELREDLNDVLSIKEEKHIGLLNVHQRIRLFFGDAYGVSIVSEVGRGTSVTVTLPVVKQLAVNS